MPPEYLVVKVGNNRYRIERCSYSDEEKDFKKVFIESLPHIANELEKVLELETTEKGEYKDHIIVCGTDVRLGLENGTDLFPDAILLDTIDGTPIIVEAKLSKNKEIRRKVLGQILEYIAAVYLNPEALVDVCHDALDSVIVEEERRKEVINKMQEKIRQKRITGLIVSDQLPEAIKHVIEIFNEDLNNFTLLGAELKRFCSSKEGIEVIVPSFVGIPAEKKVAMSKKRRGEGRFWGYEELKEYVESIEDEVLRKRALELLEWARENDLLVCKGATINPMLRIRNIATKETIFSIYLSDGGIEVGIGPKSENAYPDPSLRSSLFQELKQLNLIELESPDETQYSKYLSKKLNELTEDEYRYLFDIFKKYALNKGEPI